MAGAIIKQEPPCRYGWGSDVQQVPFQKNWTATLGFILDFVSLISPLGFTVLSPVSMVLYQKMDH